MVDKKYVVGMLILSRAPEMRKIGQFIIIYIVAFLLTFGVGLLNQNNFISDAKAETEALLREYFLDRRENVIQIVDPGHWIRGQIEVGILTDRNVYYAVLLLSNSWWVTDTALNLFMRPRLVLHRVEVAKVQKGTDLVIQESL